VGIIRTTLLAFERVVQQKDLVDELAEIALALNRGKIHNNYRTTGKTELGTF